MLSPFSFDLASRIVHCKEIVCFNENESDYVKKDEKMIYVEDLCRLGTKMLPPTVEIIFENYLKISQNISKIIDESCENHERIYMGQLL